MYNQGRTSLQGSQFGGQQPQEHSQAEETVAGNMGSSPPDSRGGMAASRREASGGGAGLDEPRDSGTVKGNREIKT